MALILHYLFIFYDLNIKILKNILKIFMYKNTCIILLNTREVFFFLLHYITKYMLTEFYINCSYYLE
jgi:hypothetical protein